MERRRKMRKGVMESDWSALPHELLVVIAKLTMWASVEDLIAFGGVCSSWRSASRDDEIVGAKSSSWPMMVPFLMLSEKKQGNREFYSVLKNKIYMNLPSVPETNNEKKKYIESRFGWVLTLEFSGEVQLMNPFSGERIQLPNYKTFPLYNSFCKDPYNDFILRSVLSANPSHTSDFVLVVITAAYMAFWRIGNHNWTPMTSIKGFGCFRYIDVNYFNRDSRFYAVSREGNICVWDADASGGDFTYVIPQPIFTFDKEAAVNIIGRYNAVYLVESSTGELLLVTRNGRFVRPELKKFRNLYRYGASEFRVYRIDVVNGGWERILNLKNEAIFVGHNAAFSIPVSDDYASVIKASSIYFTDDSVYAYRQRLRSPFQIKNSDNHDENFEKEEDNELATATGYKWATNLEMVGNAWALELGVGNIDARSGGGKDMGIYNLEDGSIQRFHPQAQTLSFTCPPLWVAPSSFSWLRNSNQRTRPE